MPLRGRHRTVRRYRSRDPRYGYTGLVHPTDSVDCLQILQPAHTLLGLDGHARRVDLPLQGVGPLEFAPRPELDCRQPKRQSLNGNRQAGVHQDAAYRVESGRPSLSFCRSDLYRMPIASCRLPRITEFRRVVQHEDRAFRRCKAFAGGLKMPGQNRRLIDPPIGKEPICRLGVGPILASQRNGLAQSGCQLPDQLPKSPSKSRVTEPAARQFLVESLRCPARGRSAGTLQRLLKQFNPSLFWHLAGSFYAPKGRLAG